MPFEGNTALGRPRTYLNIVLDESTSMEASAQITRRAFNDFIATQRAESAVSKDEVFVTLTKFSYARKVRTVFVLVPLAQVPLLTDATYKPDGDTALYDGIAHAIRSMENAVGTHARVLTLVITDGEENASREITRVEQLRQIVESREARGNWTFVFLSAGSNPYANAASMGFQPGNVRTYSTHLGRAMVPVGRAVQSYRRGDHMQTSTFWIGEAQKHERTAWTAAGTDDVEDVI